MDPVTHGLISAATRVVAQKVVVEGINRGKGLLGISTLSSCVGIALKQEDNRLVADGLRAWSTRPEFERLSELSAGECSEQEIVQSFTLVLRLSGYTPQSESEPTTILIRFLTNVWKELLKTSEGLVFHDEAERSRFEDLGTMLKINGEATRGHFSHELSRLTEQIESLGLAVQKPKDKQVSEALTQSQIGMADQFMEQGKPSSALSLLKGLERDASDHLSQDSCHTIATKIGISLLVLGDLDGAEIELRRALNLKPDDPASLANLSAVYLRRDHYEEAERLARRAYALDQSDVRVRINLAHALMSLGEQEEADLLVGDPETWEGEPQVLVAAAELYLRDNRLDEAEILLRKAIDTKPNAVTARNQLAMVLLIRYERSGASPPPSVLEEALEALNYVVGQTRNWEVRGPWEQAILNRSAVYGFQERFEEALSDAEELLRYDPESSVALLNKGISLYELGRLEEAVEALRGIKDEEKSGAAKIPLESALMRLGRYSELIGRAGEPQAMRYAAQSWTALDAIDLELSALHQGGFAEKRDEFIAELESVSENNPVALTILARQRARQGDIEEAIELQQRARQSTEDPDRKRTLSLELAHLYQQSNGAAEAAAMYRDVGIENLGSGDAVNFVIALFNSQQYGEARRRAAELRKRLVDDPVLSEVEGNIAEITGNYALAYEHYSAAAELADEEPRRSRSVIRAAFAKIRLSEQDTAREMVGDLSLDRVRSFPDLTMATAQLRQKLEMGDVLLFAYTALRAARQDERIQAGYISLFLNVGEREVGEPPTVVERDCSVLLQGESGEKTVVITSDPAELNLPDFVSAKSDIARNLLGKEVGDAVEFERGPQSTPVRFEIAEVIPKYAQAFRQLLNDYGQGLSRSEYIYAMDADPDSILRVVGESSDRADALLEVYRRGDIPIGGLVRLLNRTFVEVWQGIYHDRTTPLRASRGEAAFLEKERAVLSQRSQLVFDLPNVLMLCQLPLDVERAVEGKEILVAQQVLDELTDYFNELDPSKEGAALGKHDGQFVMQEFQAGTVQRQREFVAECVKFIRDHGEVVPAEGLADLNPEEREKVKQVIGVPALASILVAKERNVPLLCDDLGTRVIAEEKYGVVTSWTQPFLEKLYEEQALTQEEYLESLKMLCEAGARFFRVNAQTLSEMISRSGLANISDVSVLLRPLTEPESAVESVAIVLAKVGKDVWIGALDNFQRESWMDLLCTVMIQNREPRQALALLVKAIQIDCRRLVPHVGDEMTEFVQQWAAAHLL